MGSEMIIVKHTDGLGGAPAPSAGQGVVLRYIRYIRNTTVHEKGAFGKMCF